MGLTGLMQQFTCCSLFIVNVMSLFGQVMQVIIYDEVVPGEAYFTENFSIESINFTGEFISQNPDLWCI